MNEQTKETLYDVIILGGGTAGLAAYRAVSSCGKKALLIEKENKIVTTCANVGCMPSKLLIAASKAAKAVSKANTFGIRPTGFEVDAKAVFSRVRAERDRFVGFVEKGAENVNKVFGAPQFIDKNSVEVAGYKYFAKSFIVATGTSVKMPREFEGIDDIWTNETVFEQSRIPKNLLIVGAGVIGLEMAGAFNGLGSTVTLVNIRDDILGLASFVQEKIRKGVERRFNYLENTKIEKVSKDNNLFNVTFSNSPATVQFDAVMVAAGRTPNLEGFGLLEAFEESYPSILKKLDPVTNQIGGHNLFLAGDVDTSRPLLHEAAFSGRNVGHFVATGTRQDVENLTPMAVVFSDPQIMWVGAPFDSASHFYGLAEFEDQGRSRVDGINEGTIMVYFDKASKKLVGAQMVGPDAEHMAHLLSWAIEFDADLKSLLKMPFYHPVIEEGLRTALRDAYSREF